MLVGIGHDRRPMRLSIGRATAYRGGRGEMERQHSYRGGVLMVHLGPLIPIGVHADDVIAACVAVFEQGYGIASSLRSALPLARASLVRSLRDPACVDTSTYRKTGFTFLSRGSWA